MCLSVIVKPWYWGGPNPAGHSVSMKKLKYLFCDTYWCVNFITLTTHTVGPTRSTKLSRLLKFMLVYDNLQCIYTLKMEAESSSETLVHIIIYTYIYIYILVYTYHTIQYNKPEDSSPSSLSVYFSVSWVYYHHHHHHHSIHSCNFKFTNAHKTLLVYYLMLRGNAVATHRKVAC
jgi:hypothetical protein